MQIEVELSDQDREKLRAALGIQDDGRLTTLAEMTARAGAEELLSQAIGHAVFSSISDLRMFRVFCLLKAGMSLVEAEAMVALIFKIPSRSARTLVHRTLARYMPELKVEMRASITALIEAAVWNSERDRWEVRMPAEYVKEQINDLVEEHEVPHPTSADRGTVWLFADEAYSVLRQEFGLEPRSHE